MNCIRITLFKNGEKYQAMISRGLDMPKMEDGRKLVSTSPYYGEKTEADLVKIGKAGLNQSIINFHIPVSFENIEFIEKL